MHKLFSVYFPGSSNHPEYREIRVNRKFGVPEQAGTTGSRSRREQRVHVITSGSRSYLEQREPGVRGAFGKPEFWVNRKVGVPGDYRVSPELRVHGASQKSGFPASS